MPFLGGFLVDTRIIYPLQVGDWKIEGDEKLYEPREYGVSVRYRDSKHEGRWIDFYFYPAGVLAKGEFEQAAAHEIEGIHVAEKAGLYRGVQIGDPQSLQIEITANDGKKTPIDARSVGMSYTAKPGQAAHAAMTFLLDNLYFVKGRLDVPKSDLSVEDTRKLLEKFTTDVMGTVRISSTGGCWMPVDVQIRADDMKQPDNTVMAMKLKDQEVWFLPDRVLVPSSMKDSVLLTTGVFARLGMVAARRIFAGCVAPEDIIQEVHDGEREIRLHYLPPANGTPDGPSIPEAGEDTGAG